MPFPNFEGKHAHDAFFTPRTFVAYQRRLGRWLDFTAPSGVVLRYQRPLATHVLASEDLDRQDKGWGAAAGNGHGADEWLDLGALVPAAKVIGGFVLDWCGVAA